VEHQKIRPHRTPLPDRADQGRPTQILTAADPLPDDLAEVITKINSHDVH
jgi:hypothetical protein